MSRKRPRVSEYSSDSSEEWTGEWSSDKCVKIHKNTSEWTDVTLRKLHLSWDRQTITKTPNKLLDFLKIPPLTQEMENISNYIEKNIDFDMSSDNSNVKHSVRYRIFSNLQRRLRNSTHSDGESERCDQSILEHARIYGIEFLATLKKLVRREAYAQPRYKALYLRILESFCKLCGLFGSRELVRRSCKILEQDVISVPDLVFEADDSPYILGRHLRDSSGASTLCISEVKSDHYANSKVHKRQKVTRSSTDSADVSQHLSTEVFQPLEVRGSSQHVGQLLLESPHSLLVFSRSSIGLMFTKTKVMMTCLKLSESYLENMDTRLLETDRGVIYVTDTFDILKADDRNEVLNSLLRLGCCEDLLRQDHEGEESTSDDNS